MLVKYNDEDIPDQYSGQEIVRNLEALEELERSLQEIDKDFEFAIYSPDFPIYISWTRKDYESWSEVEFIMDTIQTLSQKIDLIEKIIQRM